MIKHNLPSDWKNKNFGEIFDFEKKSKHKASEGEEKGYYKFFTSSNIQKKFIDDFDFDGDFLVFGTGGSASMHNPTGKFSTSTDCLVAKMNNNRILTKYVYYYIAANMHLLDAGFKGAGLKHISKKYIQSITINYPEDLETQKKIVAILEKAERLKEWRKEADELTDEFLKNTFLEMFNHPLSINNKNVRIALNNVINIIVPTRDKPKSFTGNIPWVTLPDLSDSMYVEDSKYKLSKEEAKPTKTRLFPKETVILSCAGSLGKVAIAKREIYTNQQFYGLVCDKTKILPEFLAYQLTLYDEQFYKNIGGTSTITFFRKQVALNLEVIVPDFKKQQVFSDLVQQVEQLREHQSQSRQQIDDLFNVLMQKAFKGELM